MVVAVIVEPDRELYAIVWTVRVDVVMAFREVILFAVKFPLNMVE